MIFGAQANPAPWIHVSTVLAVTATAVAEGHLSYMYVHVFRAECFTYTSTHMGMPESRETPTNQIGYRRLIADTALQDIFFASGTHSIPQWQTVHTVCRYRYYMFYIHILLVSPRFLVPWSRLLLLMANPPGMRVRFKVFQVSNAMDTVGLWFNKELGVSDTLFSISLKYLELHQHPYNYPRTLP